MDQSHIEINSSPPTNSRRTSARIHPEQVEQFHFQPQSQPNPVRIEIGLNNALYLVSPQEFKKSEAAVTLASLSWFGLLVGLTLMFILDSISSLKSKQAVELHWSSLITTLAVTSTCLFILALYYRQTLSFTITLTLANVTWFSISLAVFYMNSLSWKFLILSIACISNNTQVYARSLFSSRVNSLK